MAPCLEVHLAEGTARKKAYIAHDLYELADAQVRNGTVVLAVGNDLPSVKDLNYLWVTKVMPEWMRRGAQIRYLAVNPSEGAQQNLRDLAAQFPPGRLLARKAAETPDPCSHEAQLKQLWERFHFVVFEHDRQLWVELNHPPGELEAYDCKHFNAEQSADLPLYEECRRNFALMFEQGRDFLA